jgi:tRNA 2-thiouridine synthesizing protein A
MSLTEVHNLEGDQHMFLSEPLKTDAETDIIYMMCPMHLLTIDEQIKEIDVGQTLSILTDYDGAIEDIPEWCKKTGNEFLGIYEESDHYKFYVKKIRES